MAILYAQGDILLERLDDAGIVTRSARSRPAQCLVLAEGETSGHQHRLLGSATLFRDDGLARDVPRELYVAHVHISDRPALLEHEEHAAIELAPGIYRVRRQRQLEPTDIGALGEYGLIED